MFCKSCGKQLVDGDKFCRGCGTPAPVAVNRTEQNKQETVNVVSLEKPKPAEMSPVESENDITSTASSEAAENISAAVPQTTATAVVEQPLNNDMDVTQAIPPVGSVNNISSVANDISSKTPVQNGIQNPYAQQPYNAVQNPYAAPKPPKKPLPKKAWIGIIGGGVALIAVIVAFVIFISVANNPINKMMGYIDSGSYTDAKQLYASDFKYNEERLASLESEVIKKAEEIKKQYSEGTLTEEEARKKLKVITSLPDYSIYKHGSEVVSYIDDVKTSEKYFQKAEEYKGKKNYLDATYYYAHVQEDTPHYEAAQSAITECKNLFVQDTIAKADEYIKNNEYSKAEDVIQDAIYDLSSDDESLKEQLENKLQEYKSSGVDAVMKKADEIAKSDGYIKAIEELYDIARDMNVYLDQDTYNNKIDEYKKAYVNQAVEEAKPFVDAGDYASAVNVLACADNKYYFERWENLEEMDKKIEEYGSKLSKSLNSIEATKSSSISTPYMDNETYGIADSAFKDADGNEQYLYTEINATYGKASADYNLNKKYESLSGKLVFGEDSEDGVTITIKFVGDGKILKTVELSSSKKSESFEIDLKNIGTFHIEAERTKGKDYSRAEAALVNTVLKEAEGTTTVTPNEPSNTDKPYASIEEYVQNSDVQDVAKAASNSTVKCEIVADGDALIMKYTYQVDIDESKISELATQLETQLAKQTSLFTNMKNELKNSVNVENPSVKMAYYTKDGKLIVEYEPKSY